ncbi:winged helix-turn-helix domain-containing protein [Parenemella sanctibonifatiensis]|uniref:Transcriptional regulator n=1 Tax=Parenemella sanctibonifatiensis TaxID=2016505 RepID=A0A255E024_9ACTN|nr:winged helix-turn-helix domain-containing protein [Parenemella sanctibonifatiensis]OYN84680.1 transcriptional regulator [Parenemella sanctibonifatiensis]
MSLIVVFTSTSQSATEIVPALELLGHTIRTLPPDASRWEQWGDAEAYLLDARTDLAAARAFARNFATLFAGRPLIAVLGEGGMAVVNADWGMTDILLPDVGPAELAARLRLARGSELSTIVAGGIVIDEYANSVSLDGRPLDLTYTEFELLKYLVGHAGRVFSRQQLVADVWGYDYFGGTRTVDVHVRRLRAKLGPDREGLIQTVRNVGYRFSARTPESQHGSADST